MHFLRGLGILSGDGNSCDNHDLYGQAALKIEKMKQKTRLYEEEKYAECTFRPTVNLISDQIVEVKRSLAVIENWKSRARLT